MINMIKTLALILVLALPSACLQAADHEEFYIVTDAPVMVGGGMIRHYLRTDRGMNSTRYSYKGASADMIFVERVTRLGDNRDVKSDFLTVPTDNSGRKRTGSLSVGSHEVCLEVKKDGRLLVKEKKRE